MNEQDDIPRADGLRPDDPPFREFFSTQPDKPTGAIDAQVRELQERHHRFVKYETSDYPGPKPFEPQPEAQARMRQEVTQEQLQPKDYAEITDMQDTNDVIATIRRIAAGGKYVHVDKLIKALS